MVLIRREVHHGRSAQSEGVTPSWRDRISMSEVEWVSNTGNPEALREDGSSGGKEPTHKFPESPRGRIIRFFPIYNISKAVKDYCLILLKVELRYLKY